MTNGALVQYLYWLNLISACLEHMEHRHKVVSDTAVCDERSYLLLENVRGSAGRFGALVFLL